MTYTEHEIRAFQTDDIYYFLDKKQSEFSKKDLVIFCDELLQRKQPIKFLTKRFEHLIKELKTTDLQKIEQFDFNYSKATIKVVTHVIKSRKGKLLEWFYLQNEQQVGPILRSEIDKLISEISIKPETLLWRTGMTSWKTLNELDYLTEEFYYDQEIIDTLVEKPITHSKAKQEIKKVNNTKISSSYTILPGVMGLLSFPLWILLIVILFFTGFTSELGIFLPFLFSAFMILSTIPVAIGLMSKKKWAWSIKITTAALTICLILFKVLVDHASELWAILLVYEAIILGLLLYGKEAYEHA